MKISKTELNNLIKEEVSMFLGEKEIISEGFLDSFKRDIIPMETEKELNRLSKKYDLEYEVYEDKGVVYIEIMNPDTDLNFFSKITIVNIYKNGLMTLADDDVSKKYKVDSLEKAFKYLKCKYNKEKGKIEQKLKNKKETSYEEELNEEKTVLPKGYEVGVRVKDSEGNEFVIRDVVSNGVTLKGQGGEIEVGVSDLKHYDIINKLNESKKDPKAEIRNRGDVVFSAGSKYVTDDKDHFPINNEKQARNALARANQYKEKPEWYKGTLAGLVKKVHNAVNSKYKNIEVTEKSLHPGKD